MHVAQPYGCAPVANAILDGNTHPKPVIPDTIAKSLAIGNPADGYYSIDIANKSKGTANIVAETDIAEGIKLLAETEGIFTETAGGVVVSSLKKLAEDGKIGKDQKTVALITGTGLKTIEAVKDLIKINTIEPNVESFNEMFSR